MKKLGILALTLALAATVALGGCAKKEVKTNYWDIREKTVTSGEKYEYPYPADPRHRGSFRAFFNERADLRL